MPTVRGRDGDLSLRPTLDTPRRQPCDGGRLLTAGKPLYQCPRGGATAAPRGASAPTRRNVGGSTGRGPRELAVLEDLRRWRVGGVGVHRDDPRRQPGHRGGHRPGPGGWGGRRRPCRWPPPGQAFEEWGAIPPAERGKYLGRMADVLSARAEELAETISAEVGTPIKIAHIMQVAGPLAHLASHARLAEEFTWEEQVGGDQGRPGARRGRGRHHALELPAQPGGQQDRPGPSRRLHRRPEAERGGAAHRLGHRRGGRGGRLCPPGVFNLVSGTGPVIGEALVPHPDVDMVSFTGSTRAGEADRRAGRRLGEAGRPRDGREVGQHPPRRRRPRQGAARRRARLLRELRSGLRGAFAHARTADRYDEVWTG